MLTSIELSGVSFQKEVSKVIQLLNKKKKEDFSAVTEYLNVFTTFAF